MIAVSTIGGKFDDSDKEIVGEFMQQQVERRVACGTTQKGPESG
jgi:hypothetical protein